MARTGLSGVTPSVVLYNYEQRTGIESGIGGRTKERISIFYNIDFIISFPVLLALPYFAT
jgi:hypothetical protein